MLLPLYHRPDLLDDKEVTFQTRWGRQGEKNLEVSRSEVQGHTRALGLAPIISVKPLILLYHHHPPARCFSLGGRRMWNLVTPQIPKWRMYWSVRYLPLRFSLVFPNNTQAAKPPSRLLSKWCKVEPKRCSDFIAMNRPLDGSSCRHQSSCVRLP